MGSACCYQHDSGCARASSSEETRARRDNVGDRLRCVAGGYRACGASSSSYFAHLSKATRAHAANAQGTAATAEGAPPARGARISWASTACLAPVRFRLRTHLVCDAANSWRDGASRNNNRGTYNAAACSFLGAPASAPTNAGSRVVSGGRTLSKFNARKGQNAVA